MLPLKVSTRLWLHYLVKKRWSRHATSEPGFMSQLFSFKVIGIFWLLSSWVSISAGEQPSLAVIVQKGQTLRNIAEEYLDDANLWQEILQASGLKSSADVKPGMELKIPQNAISLATTELAACVEAIRLATDAGARIFSSETIEKAVKQRQDALVYRKKGEWAECFNLAKRARESAREAMTETLSKREKSAEAVLRDGSGKVQSRKVKDLIWNSIAKNTVLIEKEKVRTMSDSTAEILFADESRLRLGANSQAEIQTMRVDQLNRKQESRVSLVEGDVYAMLGQVKKKKSFVVDVPGISVDSGSSKYWMSRQGQKVKIANYDKLDMKISSAGQTVLLGMNQGTIIEQGRAPSAALDLLTSPTILSPTENHTFLSDTIDLSWAPVPTSIAYRIDISSDPSFESMAYVNPNVSGTSLQLKNFADGHYYWRISAVDARGLPGKQCEKQRFSVAKDTVVPYLCILNPAPGFITREPTLQLSGIVEINAPLFINGQPATVSETGEFQAQIPLNLGMNTVTLTAQDQAGNSSEKTRHVFYTTDQPITIEYDSHLPRVGPKRFLAKSIFHIFGVTRPGVRMEIFENSGTNVGSTVSNENGWFQMFIPIHLEEQSFRISVRDASGAVTEDSFSVTQDVKPPQLMVTSDSPGMTDNPTLTLVGLMTDGTSLDFNGNPVDLDQGKFSISTKLDPGLNYLNLTAQDALGNQTNWEQTIKLDQEPPQLIHANVVKDHLTPKNTIGFSVKATDETGLKRLTTLRYSIGSVSKSMVLKRNIGSNEYWGFLNLQEGSNETIRMQQVVLEDYLGNRKIYVLH